MRVMMTVTIPNREGSDALKSGRMQAIIGKFMEEHNPEAAYFSTNDEGERSGILIFDMQDTSDMPRIGEPLFQGLGARIKFKPCMNIDDLRRGLSQVERTVATTLN